MSNPTLQNLSQKLDAYAQKKPGLFENKRLTTEQQVIAAALNKFLADGKLISENTKLLAMAAALRAVRKGREHVNEKSFFKNDPGVLEAALKQAVQGLLLELIAKDQNLFNHFKQALKAKGQEIVNDVSPTTQSYYEHLESCSIDNQELEALKSNTSAIMDTWRNIQKYTDLSGLLNELKLDSIASTFNSQCEKWHMQKVRPELYSAYSCLMSLSPNSNHYTYDGRSMLAEMFVDLNDPQQLASLLGNQRDHYESLNASFDKAFNQLASPPTLSK